MRRAIVVAAGAALLISACAAPQITEQPVYVESRHGGEVQALVMTSPRADHAAVLLNNGRVLICGGTATGNAGGVLNTAELYDPVSQKFAPTGAMNAAREGQTATLLADGTVLVAGGAQNVGFRSELSSAEIYDPVSATFRATGSMATPREGHTATRLRDGRVLIAGGSDNGTHTLASAEIYDPKTGAFSSAGRMTVPREAHTATLLLSGKVLIAGGGRGDMPGGYIAYDTAEIYDPASGNFTALDARMRNDRIGAAAVLLRDGRVLIAGGKSGKILVQNYPGNLYWFTPLNTAELYDPESGSFVATNNMTAPHYLGTATLLDYGGVLVAGGWAMQGPTIAGMRDAERFDARTNVFDRIERLRIARLEDTATLLGNGEVLIAGGIDGNGNITAAVEFYAPRERRFVLNPEAGLIQRETESTAPAH